MPTFDPVELAEITSGTWHQGQSEVGQGFAIDSRKILSGQMFLALKSEQRDGHDFVSAAASAGACAALVERVNPSLDLPQLSVADTRKAFRQIGKFQRKRYPGTVIAITGSCGKTSTRELLACLLGIGNVHATRGNLNNDLGVPLTLCSLEHQTGHAKPFAVIEAGTSKPGEIALLADLIMPHHSIITNVGATHLLGLGDIEGVAREKAALIRGTDPAGLVLFPQACLAFEDFSGLQRPHVILCSEVSDAEIESDSVYSNVLQYRFELCDDMMASGGCLVQVGQPPARLETCRLPPFSPGMIENAVLCMHLAKKLGVSSDLLQERMLTFCPPANRGSIFRVEEKIIYLDCYNASPASLLDSIAAFQMRMTSELPRLYVIGAMLELGSKADSLHFSTARKIRLRDEDRLLFHGDHAAAFKDGFLSGGNAKEQIKLVKKRTDLKNFIEGFRGAILLKGSRAYKLENLVTELTESLSERVPQC